MKAVTVGAVEREREREHTSREVKNLAFVKSYSKRNFQTQKERVMIW